MLLPWFHKCNITVIIQLWEKFSALKNYNSSWFLSCITTIDRDNLGKHPDCTHVFIPAIILSNFKSERLSWTARDWFCNCNKCKCFSWNSSIPNVQWHYRILPLSASDGCQDFVLCKRVCAGDSWLFGFCIFLFSQTRQCNSTMMLDTMRSRSEWTHKMFCTQWRKGLKET